MENKFALIFESSLTTVAGNSYGRKIFSEQIQDKIDYNEKILLIIPQQIKSIANSFLQGFFKEIVDHIGINGVEEKVNFETSISGLKEQTIESLITMR